MMDDAFEIHLNHFIEEIALILEADGLPRMHGRVFGYLLVSEPRHQSSAELAEALHASRGAISTATRSLSQAGLIRRRRVPGSRATYFEVPEDAVNHLMRAGAARMTIFQRIINSGIDLIGRRDDRDPGRLNDFKEMFDFVEEEIPGIVARWQQRKEKS